MRTKRLSVLSGSIGLAALLGALPAQAAQTLRVQVNQHGDFVMVGNTLGWDCQAGAPAPVVGTTPTGALPCGPNILDNDSAPDVFWSADTPANGQAAANMNITPANARSSALLDLPTGAEVTHAYLYWGARRAGNTADTAVTLTYNAGATATPVTAVSSFTLAQGTGNVAYESVADVTTLIKTTGEGVYRVGGIDAQDFRNVSQDVLYAGWALVVLYRLDTEPTRNLAVFDGLDGITANNPSNVSLSGFLVPNVGFDAKLGVITYEGDSTINGDSLLFGAGALTNANRLSDAQNPINNFFNGTRSLLGAPVSNAGDLPRLTGAANTLAGLDLDVVDVSSRLVSGQSSVNIRASSTQDTYFLGAFVTSISNFRPDFTTSTKDALDVNGGSLVAGDEIRYTIVARNTGNDPSTATVLTDPLPVGVTYVPGTLAIDTVAKTDAAGDDTANYVAASRTVTARLGTGASATVGGSIPIAGTSTLTFRVKVDAGFRGTISNQASITAAGQKGAPSTTTPTDGNAAGPGTPPTDTPVDQCTTDAQCSGTTPHCDTTQNPNACVGCTLNAQCTTLGPTATCNLATHACVCGAGCLDTDKDGLPDSVETSIGTNPADADSDNDGVLDGAEPSPGVDSDADGLINALDPDSDDDGLFDGTELGLGCANAATDVSLGHCRPDGDSGATKTDPLLADTDGGGKRDGSEDVNLNGVRDPGETNPVLGQKADDSNNADSDNDGLSNNLETFLGSNPNDADSDHDGLPDGLERNPSDDTDGDGLVNVRDVDSDDDGLFDGTESSRDCSSAGAVTGHCIADADVNTKTSPVKPDTDNGGATDGSEDPNRNGKLDAGEKDPTAGHAADDASVVDTDKDGLSDALETALGSKPNDADSDDDGVPDGQEANPGDDADGDGKINILDVDSDGDGLFDGTELGFGCSGAGTTATAQTCIADADPSTITSMVDGDTDRGGVKDGTEDTNHNGKVDAGERNPLNPADDGPTNPGTGDGGVDGGDGGIAGGTGSGGLDGGLGGDASVAGAGGIGGAGGTGTGAVSGTGATGTGAFGGTGATAGTGATTGTGAETGVGGTGQGGSGNGASPGDTGHLQGGGCDCNVASSGGSKRDLGALGMAMAAVVTFAARRRRRA
jgi:uncharacterized repeat protein (TIGR01451 family)/MYXO-CTERM domain-containing protein